MIKLATIYFILFITIICYLGVIECRDLRDVECDCRCDENGELLEGQECQNLIEGDDTENIELSTDLALPSDGNSEDETLIRDKRYYGGCGCCGCCMMGTPKTVTKTITLTYGGCCGCGYG
uniref:Pacifastin domain-containing protein n=1 Tax=Parastrongyloides trichosuri TaxID=131310 RepID=A0A0N4Z958_PARTI